MVYANIKLFSWNSIYKIHCKRVFHVRFCIVGVFWLFYIYLLSSYMYGYPRKVIKKSECQPDVPCMYGTQVDLRIIVIVRDRAKSLQQSLSSLKGLILDGDSAAVDIWIDRYKENNTVNINTMKVALSFNWKSGPVTVHLQTRPVGIYGQWIDTWRPEANSAELAIILEDDVDLSPWAYIWLRAAHTKYGDIPSNGGYSLYEGAILGFSKYPSDQPIFMFPRLGTHAFAPHPKWWPQFQDWFHRSIKNTSFHPYVRNEPMISSWYKTFEERGLQDTMWEMWQICFADKNHLWTIYPNIAAYVDEGSKVKGQYLAYHRQEDGLHFQETARSSNNKLITKWNDTFVNFPDKLRKYDLKGDNF